MRNRIVFVEQNEHSECGLACAVMLLNYCGARVSLNELRERFGVPRGGLSLLHLKQIMEEYKVFTRAYQVDDIQALKGLSHPCLCNWEGNHFVILGTLRDRRVILYDPAVGRRSISLEEFQESFGGVAVFLDHADTEPEKQKKKGKPLFQFILGFLRKRWAVLGVLFFVMLLLQMVYLAIPVLTQQMIDQGEKLARLMPLAFVLLAAILCGLYFLLEYVRGLLVVRLQYRFNDQLMERFIQKVTGLEFKHFINRSSGDWIYRTNVISYVQQILSSQFLFSVIDLMFVVVYLIMMLQYSGTLTLLTLGFAVLLCGISILNSRFLLLINARETIAQSRVQNTVIEFFEGIETIKSLKIEQNFSGKWRREFKRQQELVYGKNRIQILFQGVSSVIDFIFPLTLLYVGLTSGSMTTGAVVAFLSLASSFLNPVTNILGTVVQVVMLRIYFQRINDVLLLQEEPPREIEQIGQVEKLQLQNIGFSYSGFDVPVFRELELTIQKGEKIAIVGTNGSGKSTLLKMLAGLLQPQEGGVYYNDLSMNQISGRELSRMVSFVNQQPAIFNATLKENILLNQEEYTKEEVERVLEATTLKELIEELPGGWNTHVSQTGMNLSGGQKQKIALARALLKKPQVLLLDEPTSAMDGIAEHHILEELRRMDMICILISHRLSTIQQFDRIIVLDQGRIVGEGTHEKLLKSCKIYQEIYQLNQEGEK